MVRILSSAETKAARTAYGPFSRRFEQAMAAYAETPYATTVAFKSAISHAQCPRSGVAGTLYNAVFGGFWISTAAINQLTLRLENSPNFIAGSRASLYGIG